MPARRISPKGHCCLGQRFTRLYQREWILWQPSTKQQGRPKVLNQIESVFEGARLSETVGSRASFPSRSTILVRKSMCLPNPNIGGVPSFANSNPQRNPSRRHARSIPILNNTPTPSNDPSPNTHPSYFPQTLATASHPISQLSPKSPPWGVACSSSSGLGAGSHIAERPCLVHFQLTCLPHTGTNK